MRIDVLISWMIMLENYVEIYWRNNAFLMRNHSACMQDLRYRQKHVNYKTHNGYITEAYNISQKIITKNYIIRKKMTKISLWNKIYGN